MNRRAPGGWWILLGLLVAGVGVGWLWAACGFPHGVAAARAHLEASFERFDAALPLALALAGSAIWMIAVPVGGMIGGVRRDAAWCAIVACAVPVLGFALAHGIVGGLVARDARVAGWSPWQDVVAQFCLPAGAVASVGCGALALVARGDVIRQAPWASALSGGLVLMALGRADAGGASAGLALALSQWVVVGIWVLAEGPEGRISRWRAWADAGCAASLAGVWPLPGGLARWRLLEEMWGGGFGVAWDRALLVALVLSWLLTLVAWAARTWPRLARKSR